MIRDKFAEPDGMDYVGNCIRPPSEANSILLQATLGCSYGKCTFCGTYLDKPFAIKDQAIIEQDLRFAEKYCRSQKRLFVMDGDALIMPMERWVWLLTQIKQRLPWVNRVGVYANHKAVASKSDEDLRKLKELGLTIAYYGVESGDEQVLQDIDKGGTAAELLKQGRRLIDAGIKVSATVLLGIAGPERSLEHARHTGELLSAMDPDYVGALTVLLLPGTILAQQAKAGKFKVPDSRGLLRELREMLNYTNLSGGLFLSNHISNQLPIKAALPRDKEKTLALIDQALEGEVRLRPRLQI